MASRSNGSAGNRNLGRGSAGNRLPRFFNPLSGGSAFGDGTYSGNIIQSGSVLQPVNGTITITGAATVAPDPITGSAVFSCQNLVVDGAGASLKASANCKGLLGFVSGSISLINGGTVSMTALGKAGNFGDINPYDLAPVTIRRKLNRAKLAAFTVKGRGAEGAIGKYTTSYGDGVAGAASSLPLQSGGGGSGACNINTGNATSGHAGFGGPFCGGAGSGGICNTGNGYVAANAADYGGPATKGESTQSNIGGGGGAGDPVGAGDGAYQGLPGAGPGGGLLMLFSPSASLAAGCIVQADGSVGGGSSNSYGTAGGSAGGGIVAIITLPSGFTNAGTLRANGGAAATANRGNGGPGGAGYAQALTVS